jgi:hypothetical protein
MTTPLLRSMLRVPGAWDGFEMAVAKAVMVAYDIMEPRRRVRARLKASRSAASFFEKPETLSTEQYFAATGARTVPSAEVGGLSCRAVILGGGRAAA